MTDSGVKTQEVFRKLIHVAFGFLAFSVALLGPLGSTLLVLAALAFNAFILPHVGGRRLWRPDEMELGRSAGMLFYPASVLALVLIFWHRPEVAAATWGVLAFGDGAAALAGTLLAGPRLPWNPEKTWAGTFAYWVCGSLAAAILVCWTLAHSPAPQHSWPFLVFVAMAAAAFSAALESLPQKIDDNLSVPIPTGLVLLGLLSSSAYWASFEPAALLGSAAVGFAVNLVFGLAAMKARSIDVSGLVAGTAVGTTIWAFLGWRGFLLLGAFFVLGSAATRLGYRDKASRHLAQGSGGARSARHALANAGVPAILAVFAVTTPHTEIYLAAFAGAFAAATSDTLESEIGQLFRGRTVLLTTFEPVAPGTDGAVSAPGTLAGVAGAFAMAVLGWAVGFYPPAGIAVVAAAGFLGSLVDSLLGATLERRGLLDNEAVNFTCTLAGGILAAGLASS